MIPPAFHFVHRRQVEFADTDLAGIVHFANFFRYVEAAEHAFFRSLGHRPHTAAGGLQQGWPRLEVSSKYHRPARFEQTLEICLRLEELRSSSLRYGFWIFVADDPARPLLVSGAFTIVHVEIDSAAHDLRKSPIPETLRQKLQALLPADGAAGAHNSPRTSSPSASPA